MKKSKPIITVFVFLGLIVGISTCSNHQAEIKSLQSQVDSVSIELAMLKAASLQLESNKKLVSDLYQEVFGDKNIDVLDNYLVENYIQHNPGVADGREALKKALEIWFKDAPKEKIDIQHIGADCDFVYIHLKSKQGNKTLSVIDIFKIEGNKVVEHWDVIQEVPAKSANPHPMF